MSKIKIERGESVRTAPVVARISMGELRKRLGIPDGADISIAGTVIVEGLSDEDVLVAEWTETKAVRTRKREA